MSEEFTTVTSPSIRAGTSTLPFAASSARALALSSPSIAS
jgi:hypothetical protein